MVNIFIWVGHPKETSLSAGLADAYAAGAKAGGAQIRRMDLSAMRFDPNLSHGYNERVELEDDLRIWQENILWASDLAWVYPYWWGGMPAMMKGVIDRAYLPGFAMRYHEHDPWWDQLLEGRRADVLMTADSPRFFDRLKYGRPGFNQVKNLVLEFAGIKLCQSAHFGTTKTANPKKIARWLAHAEKMGAKAAKR